jgi:hypothetical protein
MGRWGVLLALAVALTAQVSLAQKKPATPKKAQTTAQKKAPKKGATAAAKKQAPRKVVVLDFEGDRRGKVRSQVESALRKSREVKLVPLKQYTAAAAKERLRGAAAREPSAVRTLAPRLGLEAAVTGEVGQTLRVRVLSASGAELLIRELPLKKGALASADAKTLAADILAATTAPAPLPEPAVEPPPATEPAPTEPAPTQPTQPPATTPTTPAPTEPVQPPATTPTTPPAQPQQPTPPVADREPLTPPAPAPDGEAHTTTTPPEEAPAAQAQKAHPPIIRLFLGGTTTWRKYCARPGVGACRDFDARPEEEQQGDTVSFDTSVPYLGVGLDVEFLPLARMDNRFLRGLGLSLGVQRGYSETTVQLTTPSGETPSRQVVATDTSVSALGLYRYYFELGKSRPLLGYAGLRGGFMGRAFDVDESAQSPLAGTHRLHPVVGLEVSVPLAKAVRIEGAGHVFFKPVPGKWVQDETDLDLEVRDFGETVSSSGWSAELGLAGDIWGPLGYSARFRLTHFKDTFTGAGVRTGWLQGGVAEETYSSLHWGLTAAW